MPRKPVDQVIEHRYSLSQYERDQLDTLITGLTFRNASEPVVALLSDPVAIAATIGLAEALGIIDITGWIKENTWADEIIAAVISGAYEVSEEVLGDLDKAAENVNKTIETIEDTTGDIKIATVSPMVKIWVTAQIFKQRILGTKLPGGLF